MEGILRVQGVQTIGTAQLLVIFDNGVRKIYDCEPLLSRPEFRLLATPAFFKAVRVDPGGYGVSWSEAIDLSEFELWTRGRTVADQSLEAAAKAGG